MDWKSLKPGRELDALVAEKVLGCKVLNLAGSGPTCCCNPDQHNEPSVDHDWGSYLKRYSTDIAAAWEVLEKFRKEEKPFRLEGNRFGWTVA